VHIAGRLRAMQVSPEIIVLKIASEKSMPDNEIVHEHVMGFIETFTIKKKLCLKPNECFNLFLSLCLLQILKWLKTIRK
jgi:hypothetical protein